MTQSAPTEELLINRVFDAPREHVYKAFTDADQLSKWFGPVGFSVPRESVEIDARTGGYQRFVMVSDDDPTFKSSVDAKFVEVIENELIVGIEDWDGVPDSRGPTTGMSMRIELSDEGGKTRLRIRQGPFTEEMVDMARRGWESSFTKLDKVLST